MFSNRLPHIDTTAWTDQQRLILISSVRILHACPERWKIGLRERERERREKERERERDREKEKERVSQWNPCVQHDLMIITMCPREKENKNKNKTKKKKKLKIEIVTFWNFLVFFVKMKKEEGSGCKMTTRKWRFLFSPSFKNIFIVKGFRTIVFIFIVISTTFRSICPPVFFRCLSNSRIYRELRTTSFI